MCTDVSQNDATDKKNVLMAGIKSREVDLAYDRFDYEKEHYEDEISLRKSAMLMDEKKHAFEQKESTKRALILSLITSGKNATEIDEYLTLLNYK